MAIDPVRRYLSLMEYADRSSGQTQKRPHAFVTISRQAGAGGRTLADALAKLLPGWQVFDQELCTTVAKDPNLSVSLESLLTEDFKSELEDYLGQLVAGSTPQVKVLQSVFRTVRSVAKLGQAVIVGRGGSCLTRDLPGGVHVRLVAGRRSRIARLMRTYGWERPEAEKRIDPMDASRARLVRVHFGKDIDDPLLYDAVWNTDSVPFVTMAAAIAVLVRERSAVVERLEAAS